MKRITEAGGDVTNGCVVGACLFALAHHWVLVHQVYNVLLLRILYVHIYTVYIPGTMKELNFPRPQQDVCGNKHILPPKRACYHVRVNKTPAVPLPSS